MDRNSVVEKLKSLVGQGVGVSDWILIDQKRIDQFAECTDDHQWIHVDVEKAAKGPFGKTIAHGFLTLSAGCGKKGRLFNKNGLGAADK